MKTTITILYAYRSREPERVRQSLLSLSQQTHSGFQVLLVDYGSTNAYAKAVQAVVNNFDFATYAYVGHQGLLWCKARALNYGISQLQTSWCLISDVDVLFHPNLIAHLYQQTLQEDCFYLADIGYLPYKYHINNLTDFNFQVRQPKHIHETFGVGLFSTKALRKVKGVDTFFHFYGSEDGDLNWRLEQAGCTRSKLEGLWLQHLWHERYPNNQDHLLTQTPRLQHIMRINQQHLLQHMQEDTVQYKSHLAFGAVYNQADYERLLQPDVVIELPNNYAVVLHTLREVLPAYQNKVARLLVYTDDYFLSFKYKVKRCLGKETRPYVPLKRLNDLILTEILFKYRDYNYSYKVSDDLNSLEFIIEL